MTFVNNNGEIFENSGPTIRAGSRAFLYGDGVFESIRIVSGRPINLENHIKRMLEGAKKLKMRPPTFYDEAFFEERILELLQKSNIRGEINRFELNAKGLEVDLFMELKKPKTSLSNFKTKNGLIYILAAITAKEKGLDDYLISNESGGILESTSANLFVVSNGVLYTPGLEEGCLAGTMRMQVINLAIENGIKIYECNILPQNLLVADEIFLTNAIKKRCTAFIISDF